MYDAQNPAPARQSAEDYATAAASALQARDRGLQALIDRMPVPLYLTDEAGWVTFFNRACIDFAGRVPVAGKDRWCVTWRLHTEEGEPLPHHQCPMAVAIQEQRKVRGAVAVAERPDGSRVMFTPYPTPILDAEGELVGAVNILIDLSDHRQAEALRVQAARCRRLARTVSDPEMMQTLRLMADEYDGKARLISA